MLVSEGTTAIYDCKASQKVKKNGALLNLLVSTDFVCELFEMEPVAVEEGEGEGGGEGETSSMTHASYRVNVPMDALLQGDTKIEGWYPLSLVIPAPESLLQSGNEAANTAEEGQGQDADEGEEPSIVDVIPTPIPEVYISLVLSSPLVTPQEIEEATIVTVSDQNDHVRTSSSTRTLIFGLY
jgi:hypothetical protein